MATIGSRGKTAEALVKKILSAETSAHFAWHRPADARAGSFQPALCDFLTLNKGKLTVLEVKEVNHDFRLSHGNFKPEQVARMRIWEAAGAAAWVMVYFTPQKLWRYESISYFLQREGGSWDMRSKELMPLKSIMEFIL